MSERNWYDFVVREETEVEEINGARYRKTVKWVPWWIHLSAFIAVWVAGLIAGLAF